MTGLGTAIALLDADHVVFGSLVAAGLFVSARWATSGVGLGARITGNAKFDLKNSWVSNTAVFGAILVGALKDNFLGLGSTPSWLSTVHLLFALLALVAPIAFAASLNAAGDAINVWAYLVSSWVALWAASGQLLTLACAVMKAAKLKEHILTLGVTRVFLAATILAVVAIAVFAWKAMYAHLHTPPGAGMQTGAPAPPISLL